MPVDTPFLRSSSDVVRGFLSSAVLVDDQAYLVAPEEEAVPTELISPRRQGATRALESSPKSTTSAQPIAADIEGNDKNVPVTPVQPIPSEPTAALPSRRDHTLDGKTVIDVFAKIGVVCAVMRPAKEELAELSNLVMNVGANADVIILDWVLYGSRGGMTLDLINRLVSFAAETGRARLILVYTAETNLTEIETSVRNRLGLANEVTLEPFTIVSGGTRICIYGKAGTRPAPIGEVRSKLPSELADVAVAEFTQMTKGLLSNVAMKSITAIRSRTFQLLKRFDSDIDAPYATQSTLISPERADEQLTALIVSEIQEILEDEDVGSFANHARILEWLDDRRSNGLTLPSYLDLTADEYYAGLVQLLRDGVGKTALAKLKEEHAIFISKIVAGNQKEPAMYVRNALTGILRSNPVLAHEADELLTMLMSLRHRYTKPAPQLALGAIVSRTRDGVTDYLLCLQPICDSVRLKKARQFPFLSLTTVDSSKNCELIVRDAKLCFLAVKPSPYLLDMISFAPNRNEKVMADSKDGAFFFASGDDVAFKWIADLKPAHAQRIANNFSSTFSRVGLIESEWNRLGSKL